MTRRYRATTFSIAVAGALAIAPGIIDDGGGATVCGIYSLFRDALDHEAGGQQLGREERQTRACRTIHN
jgi:hypothetical protein